jgi:hypothetical protein
MWNGLEIAKLVASLTTPIVVALIGFGLNSRLKKQDDRLKEEKEQLEKLEQDRREELQRLERDRRDELDRQERDRKEELDRQERDRQERLQAEKDELLRQYSPHIELALDCAYHKIRGDTRLTTFTVSAKNVGQVRHQIDRIKLRVRAINDEPFAYRNETAQYLGGERRQPRVLFPHKVLETDLVPDKWNFVFIEPGVTQTLSFTKPISVDHCYLLAHVIFEYDEYEPHSAETVFEVPPAATR